MSHFPIAPRNLVLIGDAVERLKQLPDNSIDSVVTSPPYWALRDYGIDGQLGLEPSVDDWVHGLRAVLREIHRVLVPTGTVWLNLGDTFSTRQSQGAPRKSLLLGPERVALWLVADGWIVRNKVVWAKSNAMPSSVRDRLACNWESVFVLTKQPVYFFDLDAIRRPHISRPSKRHRISSQVHGRESWRGPNAGGSSGLDKIKAAGRVGHPLGANPGDVWRIASTGYKAPDGRTHHATFPIALAERTIKAGTPEARCTSCKTPWHRPLKWDGETATRGDLAPLCTCKARREPGLVLDPFFGSGTTAVAAEPLGREWLGIELNPAYAALAETRISQARATPDSTRRAA